MKTKQNKTKQNINKHLFLKFSKNEESIPAVQIHHILLFHWRQNLIRQFQLKTNLKTKLLKDSGRTNWNFRENFALEMYNKAREGVIIECPLNDLFHNVVTLKKPFLMEKWWKNNDDEMLLVS